MYNLVTNIPDEFHTSELRNFFSRLIESDAFICFHFRHRPHKNFVTLLSGESFDNQTENQLDPVSHTETSDLCQLSKSSPTFNPTNPSPNRPSCELEPNEKSDSDSTLRSDNFKSSSKITAIASSKSCCQEEICELQVSEPQNGNSTECSSSGSGSQHWISSGLSGLTSLIKEKKHKLSAVKENTVMCKNSKYVKCNSACENEVIFQPNFKSERSVQTENSGCKQNEKHAKLSDFNEILRIANGKCCILEIKEDFVELFRSLYHKKLWVNRNGEILPQHCLILNIDLNGISSEAVSEDYLTRRELAEKQLKTLDLKSMIEFHPPSIMPKGNVGTPTQHFQDLIRSCQLPGNIIAKLGLQFPRSRGRKKFGQVPYDYGTEVCSGNTENQEKHVVFTASGDLIPASVDFSQRAKKPSIMQKKSGPKLELVKEAEDGAETEEWERYESFHNDVTSQDRTKERLYEKEIELVWEKGGPGLVFYTDAQYWREQEGDFDEQTADEWDVDMSVYYDKGAGDSDARDSIQMLESSKLRSGSLSQSAFKAREMSKNKRQRTEREKKIKGPAAPPKIGKFEDHTRGFGRRLMESQGWSDGLGLGRKEDGLPYALDNDGQHPLDKKGFGYHGEKMQGWGKSSTSLQKQQCYLSSPEEDFQGIHISTIFDAPATTDPAVSHLRSGEPTRLSHSKRNISFTKASDET